MSIQLIPPKDEGRTIVERLAAEAPERIDIYEALDLLSGDEYDPDGNWKCRAQTWVGHYFEEVIGARLVEKFDGFNHGPDGSGHGNSEIDFQGNYLWDFKSSRSHVFGEDENGHSPSNGYDATLNRDSTLETVMKEWGSLGFVFLKYRITERETEDNPEGTIYYKKLKGKEPPESVSKRRRVHTEIEPVAISAYWIDGPQAWNNYMDADIWDNTPISRRSGGKTVIKFNPAVDTDLLTHRVELV